MRLSLAPTAAADVAAGVVFGARGSWLAGWTPWLVIAASLAIYHGNMALNDWADREHDARTRATRPLPAQAISPGAALSVGSTLIVFGVCLAFLAHMASGVWMCAVASIAVAYNLVGRGPWSGPLLLALCRAGNLAAGLLLASWSGATVIDLGSVIVLCGLYGGYVFSLSRMGRMEDGEDGRALGQRPRTMLFACAMCLACVAFAPRWSEGGIARFLAFALAGASAVGLLHRAWSTAVWTRAAVESAMGLTLRRLLVFTSSVALLSLGPNIAAPVLVAATILIGYPLSRALRGVFPPT